MKKLLLLVMILITTVNYAQVKTDEELVRRTEEWFKNNPNSMPHWMTPEELERINEIGKNFIETAPPVGPVRQTAEFERMQSVLVRYPFGIPVDLIKEMSFASDITTIVADNTQKDTVINTYISAGIDTSKCDFLMTYTESYWTRDYGSWYVVNGDNEVGICDFMYNRPRPGDDAVPSAMASYLSEPYYGMSVVHTGGNYMTDGMGIAASTDIVYTESFSTLGISPEEVDQRMNDYLGIHTYHVVDDPNNTYIDHIDCWGKFLDVDKILIREVPISHAQYSEIEAMAAYFASQKSSYGNNYQVYRVNTPNDEPYSNSLILNDHVFVPVIGGSNDAAALQAYQNAMPGYTIVPVMGLASPYEWQSTDALHCRTRGVADKEMLHIYHVAKVIDQPATLDHEINARIVSYGGHSIVSADLFYKINSGSWESSSMVPINGNYTATIPQQSPGTLVTYYIKAEDNSGRIENHPFIGLADPHQFTVSDLPVMTLSQTDTLYVTSTPEGYVTKKVQIGNEGSANLTYNSNFQYKSNQILTVESNDFDSGMGNYVSSGIPAWSTVSGMTSNCARVTATQNRLSTSTLTSDIFDGTTCNSLVLEFDQIISKNSTDNSSFTVEYYDGSDWIELYSSTVSTNVFTALPLTNLSSNMQIRFVASVSARNGADSWSIDNISVSGPEIYPHDWLRLDGNLSTSGTVFPSSVNDIDVDFDASGLNLGNYYADITINSNDVFYPSKVIPVKLTVSDALSAPSNLIVLSASSSSVQLGWDSVSGASIYNIYRSELPYSGFTNIGTSATATYTDSNVSSGNKYFYYITSGDGK